MADRPESELSDEERWERELADAIPATQDPDYWTTLEANARRWAQQVGTSNYWLDAKEALASWRTEFHSLHRGSLVRGDLPAFVHKSAGELRGKAFRWRDRNEGKVLGVWDPPVEVPILNDIVRTRVECRFLDGVEFLGDRLEDLARTLGVFVRRDRRALGTGYFAQHLYVMAQVDHRVAGVATPLFVWVEIQIATVMSTQVWDVAHKIYEAARTGLSVKDDAADWDPRNPHFLQRQMGHLAHLADAVLLQLRDVQLPTDEDK